MRLLFAGLVLALGAFELMDGSGLMP